MFPTITGSVIIPFQENYYPQLFWITFHTNAHHSINIKLPSVIQVLQLYQPSVSTIYNLALNQCLVKTRFPVSSNSAKHKKIPKILWYLICLCCKNIIFILGFPSGEDVMWTISHWNTPIANHESHELFRIVNIHLISNYCLQPKIFFIERCLKDHKKVFYVFDVIDILFKEQKFNAANKFSKRKVLPLQDVSEAEPGAAAVGGRGAASTQALLVCIEMCTKVKLVFS